MLITFRVEFLCQKSLLGTQNHTFKNSISHIYDQTQVCPKNPKKISTIKKHILRTLVKELNQKVEWLKSYSSLNSDKNVILCLTMGEA